MNTSARWWRFNLVGGMGMLVQLAALAFLSRRDAGHYLYASAAAIELALLHNFAWHTRYTWRDRRDASPLLKRLTRFHFANGITSLLGNLALMRIMVDRLHFPIVISNAVAILCCSTLNFALGDKWAFAAAKNTAKNESDEGLLRSAMQGRAQPEKQN